MLYKYRELNQCVVNTIIDPKLYFALPSSLNDPLELEALINFEGSNLDVADHFQGYVAVLEAAVSEERADLKAKHERYVDGDLTIYAEYHRRRGRIEEYDRKISFAKSLVEEAKRSTNLEALKRLTWFWDQALIPLKMSGICSLAGKPDNELMWAHYAKNHTGVCYEFSDDLFADNKKVIRRKVKYTRSGIIDAKSEGYLATFEGLFSTKSAAWSYEDETRYFIFGDPRALSVSHSNFTAIILGCRFYENEQFDTEVLEGRRKIISDMVEKIESINKSRSAGMKLKLRRIIRTKYGFTVEDQDTGEELRRMRAL